MKPTKPILDPELIDEEITEKIKAKIAAAEDADSGWFVGYAIMRMLPVMKRLDTRLFDIQSAIAHDRATSVADNLSAINSVIYYIHQALKKLGGGE
jgi:hypothetical protein